MSRFQFFLILSAVILLFELILPALVLWPIFIFPVFVIWFMLTSKAYVREISYVITTTVIFDLLSGYHFGFMTFVTLITILLIFLFKVSFNVNAQSFFSLASYVLIFTFAYLAILSIDSEPRLILAQTAVITTETLILFLIFTIASHKFIKAT